MTDKDNVINISSGRAKDVIKAIRESQLAQGLNELNQRTPIQDKITHLQGQIGALWLSIPDQGEKTDNPQPWEPWMLKSIVQTLNELDKFLTDWYRDEDRY